MDETTTSTTTTDRPASMSDALASVEPSSGSTPETQSADPSTPVAATAQPGAEQTETTESVSTDQKKEPPQWRWQDILENARKTSSEEAEKRIRQEYDAKLKAVEPFSQMSEQDRHGLLIWNRAMAGDAQARQMVAQVNQPLAQSLGWAPAAQADPEPEADLQTADGMLVYSAPQQKKREEWFKRQLSSEMEQKFSKELQPLQTVAQNMRMRENQAAYNTTVASVIAKMKAADPEFDAHKAAVGELIQSDPRLQKLALDDGDPETAIEIAWGRVYRSKVLPAKEQKSEEKVLTDLQRRAVAGTTNPAAASTSTPRRPRSMTEALSQQGA
jgi:hypothetical protein